jgi:predicted lipoprotein with Yx(FWY)xxD motif
VNTGRAVPVYARVQIRIHIFQIGEQGDRAMKLAAAAGILLFGAMFAYAQKPCEELKSEIANKLDAKGVTSYTLEIVAKDKDAEGKVVGTCEGGTKKIMYRRTSQPSQTPVPPKDAKK